jgi:IS5 family transposase
MTSRWQPWASSGVGLQRTGTPGKARQAHERTRAFRRLRNWRVGIEARISYLKRAFGLRRTRLRRLGGARTWVGLGIFAYNLQRMTVITWRRHRHAPATMITDLQDR